jgi:hypothetical protein
LLLGLTALILATPAPADVARRTAAELSLDTRIAHQQRVIRQDRQVHRFSSEHRSMLARHNPYRAEATRQVRLHRSQLRWTTLELIETRAAIQSSPLHERTRALRRATPHSAIRAVFGGYAFQALAVARCESELSTGAQNGQYRGLFQMGSNERALYGHGGSAYAQARAAYRYFVASGRDWGPWGCKPW